MRIIILSLRPSGAILIDGGAYTVATIEKFPMARARGALPLTAITAAFAHIVAGPGVGTAPHIEVFDDQGLGRLVIRRMPDDDYNFAVQLLLLEDQHDSYQEYWGAMLRLSPTTLLVEDIQTWDGQPAGYGLRKDVFEALAMAREGLAAGKLTRATYQSYQ
jgi:hypothetical protein